MTPELPEFVLFGGCVGQVQMTTRKTGRLEFHTPASFETAFPILFSARRERIIPQ